MHIMVAVITLSSHHEALAGKERLYHQQIIRCSKWNVQLWKSERVQ